MRLLPLLAVVLFLALPCGGALAIVGGQPATRAYPHMGALLYDSPGAPARYDFICGASLIAPDLVLTAGHCVTDSDGGVVPAGSLRVLLGARRLSRPQDGETIPVASVLREPSYDDATASYDLALLRLAQPASEAPIRVAAAEDRGLWAPGAVATVIGWGAQLSPDPAGLTLSDELREVSVHVQSDAACASSAVLDTFSPQTMLCAGETTGGKDACQGDSGGPLMSIGADSALTLVGVVSKGMGCGYPTQYGVYARVGEGPLRAWLAGYLPQPAAPVAQAASTAVQAARPAAAAKHKTHRRAHKRRHRHPARHHRRR